MARATSMGSRPKWSVDHGESSPYQLRQSTDTSTVHSSDAIDLKKARLSYWPAYLVTFMYGLAFSVAIPAFPKLILSICDGDSAKASYYNGLGITIRYVLEFFFSPIMGKLSDVLGRKPVLYLSQICIVIEFFILGFFPRIEMIFITRAISGFGDTSISTLFTIYTDLVAYNDDELTSAFGYLAALFSLSFIVGPVAGGVLCDKGVHLCLFVAGALGLATMAITKVLFKETLLFGDQSKVSPGVRYLRHTLNRGDCCGCIGNSREDITKASGASSTLYTPISRSEENSVEDSHGMVEESLSDHISEGSRHSADGTPAGEEMGDVGVQAIAKSCACCPQACQRGMSASDTCKWFTCLLQESNPLPEIMFFLRMLKVRQLMVPYFVSNLASGVAGVFYIFMNYRFGLSSTYIGLSLSFYALSGALVLASTGYIIPKYVSERQAVVMGFFLMAAQYAWIAFSTTLVMMVIAFFFSIGNLADPALKGLLVKASVEIDKDPSTDKQGSLQGALGSLRTLAGAASSFFFSWLFGVSISREPPMDWWVFVVQAGMVLLCGVYCGLLFAKSSTWYIPQGLKQESFERVLSATPQEEDEHLHGKTV